MNFHILTLLFISEKSFCFVSSKCTNEAVDTFDFVIIGGGTAGCIIAARLSENKHFRVGLLEAGGEPPLLSKIPSLAALMYRTEVDWNYTSIPQKNSLLGYPNQVMNLTRGKMLGGTGSLNDMNFFRGNKLDYLNWRKDGLKGWGWKKVQKYFKKIEHDNEEGVDPKYHGYKGPICIMNPGQKNPFIKSLFASLTKLGYVEKDPNGDGTQTGYSLAAVNVCKHQRQSTYTNYLKPVISRSNLKVETFSFVERILFDGSKKATGVVYSKNGCSRIARVNKEVIVSGGAINSPQLLMLSGIGPKNHLKSFNISMLSDLPVGKNFQDHIKMVLTFTKPYEDIYNNETLKQFFKGKGPLTNFSFGNAFINSRYSNNKLNPDVQLSLTVYSLPAKMGQNLEFTFYTISLRPKSRGLIRLKSNNPYDYPIINPRYLSNEQDVKDLADATRLAVSIMDSMNVSEYGYSKSNLSVAACNQYDRNNDDFWKCVVRNNMDTLYHYCGTCRMGAINKKWSVVDDKLKVIGVNGVRVIDASVIPSIVSANIQAPVMMIAERAADFIKADYSSTKNK